MDEKHIIVIGSGIVGASIARHLARAGARVTVLEADAAEHSAWGYGVERANAEQPLGATIHEHTPVTAYMQSHGRINGVRTEQHIFEANEVVLAAGTSSASLLSGLGLNYHVDAPAGLLVHSKPTAPLLRTLLMVRELLVRQTTKGRLVAGADYVGSFESLDPQLLSQQLFSKVQAMVRGAERLEMDFFNPGQRPTPGDGFPMVGRPGNMDGLYMAVTHSGGGRLRQCWGSSLRRTCSTG